MRSFLLFISSLVATSGLGKIFAQGRDHKNSESEVVDINGVDESSEYTREIMMVYQECQREERRKRNQTFLTTLSNNIGGGLANSLIWIKENLHPSTNKILIEDYNFTGNCCERLVDTLADAIENVRTKCSRGEESRWSLSSLMKTFKSALLIYADILKDVLIVMALLSILGVAFFWDIFSFSSLITWILLISIIVPLAISTVSVLRRDPSIILGWKYHGSEHSSKKLLAMRLVVFFLWFAVPVLILITKEEAKFKQRRLLKQMARNLDSVSMASLQQLRSVNKFLEASGKEILVFRRAELGLEVVIQPVVQLLMLLLSPTYTTNTATHSGLQAIFETDFTSMGETASKHIPGNVEDITKGLLIFSVLWSIKTTATTYIKIKTEERQEVFTFASKSLLGVRSLLIYAVRITCILAFFGPALGLLDCLAHWKAAQLTKNPPHFTEWTVISLGASLAVFSALLFVQMALMTLLKWALSKDFKEALKDRNLSSITQHLFLTVNIPDNYKDWDQSGGSLAEHKQRKLEANRENLAMIIVHNISNLLLLVPLWTTGVFLSNCPSCTSSLQLAMSGKRTYLSSKRALPFLRRQQRLTPCGPSP